MADSFIPPHGGYRKLLSYEKATIVYDATVYFCDRFLSKKDRTYDQMIQAARSGKQNIVEGSQASGTSKSTELKLTGVARASLAELLADYRDFLRKWDIEEWPREHPYAQRLSELSRQRPATYETFRKGIEHPDRAICINVIIGLIKLTNFLLDKQIERLERDFVEKGGVRERMFRVRVNKRDRERNDSESHY
ncbi:MAG: four helix bundle suffix domain-containing protein [Candidatus Brocadiia bacterium]